MFHSLRGLALILLVFVFASFSAAQEGDAEKPNVGTATVKNSAQQEPEIKQRPSTTAGINEELSPRPKITSTTHAPSSTALSPAVDVQFEPDPVFGGDPVEMRKAWALGVGFGRRINPESTPVPAERDHDDPLNPPLSEKFHWKPAIIQSFAAQGAQHAYAVIFQNKTQRALKGPFFRDYWESVKRVDGWSDGNRAFTNYVAHPMQGSFTGFVFVQNHDRVKKQIFAESGQYWKDRLKVMAWSAAWSTNWELGPISQSSIGNVGLYGHQGWVDLVITPTVGTAWMITEEAIDRYIIRHHDDKSLTSRILLRTFLNPTRSVANVFRFKVPWHRDAN